MQNLAIAPHEMAARLAARLCHDLMGPAGGVVSGVELLKDPSARSMHGEALELIAASGERLVSALTFARVAFGTGGPGLAGAELEGLARGLFADRRASLDWTVGDRPLGSDAGRILLNLTQLALGALPAGGVARASAETRTAAMRLSVEAADPRAMLHEEVRAGLNGEALGAGLAGRWIQARYLNAMVAAAGGSVSVEAGEGLICFAAELPG